MSVGLVSVVICAYDNWPDVEMTIESALHQSYRPMEVIVVDNSSTDQTPEEVPRHFGNRVRYIRQPNRECGGAYNAGFALTSGEFIQFVDGDDVLAPNKIAKQVEVFRANPEVDIVYGDIRMFQTLGGRANWVDAATQPEPDMLKFLVSTERGPEGIDTLGMLFRRRTVERVGAWDESLYCEDLDYWLRAAHAGLHFGHCPGSLMGLRRLRFGQKTNNHVALDRGIEAVWEKTLRYVTREPYRSLIAAHLARIRFRTAVSTSPRREALARLAIARATSSDNIPALAYAAGCAAILVPAVAHVASLRWLRPIRHVFPRSLRSGVWMAFR